MITIIFLFWYFLFIMKTKELGLVALLAAGVLTLAGCGKTEAPIEENAEIANPASVYCEENGWTLMLEEWAWLCMFDDGSYCEEWAFMNSECQPWDIMYNVVSEEEFIDDVEQKTDWNGTSEIYSDEDLQAAVDTIMNTVENEWEVKVEMQELFYAWDDAAASNLEYCQSLNPEVTECAVFTTNFHIPEQDVQMAGAFEPNTDINGYSWFLGKNTAGEWEVLTNGFG